MFHIQEQALASLTDWLSDSAIASNPMLLLVAGIIYAHEQNYNEALKHTHVGGTLDLWVQILVCGERAMLIFMSWGDHWSYCSVSCIGGWVVIWHFTVMLVTKVLGTRSNGKKLVPGLWQGCTECADLLEDVPHRSCRETTKNHATDWWGPHTYSACQCLGESGCGRCLHGLTLTSVSLSHYTICGINGNRKFCFRE